MSRRSFMYAAVPIIEQQIFSSSVLVEETELLPNKL
jgi:hypothetical protein